jgi:hypothetical protein
MKHARPDYQEAIVDNRPPGQAIDTDEPVFLLRAQDDTAPATVEFWAIENIKNGGDPELTKRAILHAQKMREWQQAFGHKPADLVKAK